MDVEAIEAELSRKAARKADKGKICMNCKASEKIYYCDVHKKSFCSTCLAPSLKTYHAAACEPMIECIWQRVDPI